MAAIKEKDLPTAGSIANSDYLRMVTAGGESKIISFTNCMANIPEPDDYIVDHGTSGNWTFRKWNSGVAECWGSFTETKSFSSWGSVFSIDLASVNYPSNFFISTPLCFATLRSDNANAVASLDGGYGAASKDTTPAAIAIRGANASNAAFTKEYYAIGKWK